MFKNQMMPIDKRTIAVSAFALLLVILIAAVSVPGSASPQADPLINQVYITNVRDNNFTVSWTTDILSNGIVTYGTGTPATTKSDDVTSTTTHYVIVTPVTPNTTYKFKVTSGATNDDNGGAYYQVTTGPTLNLPQPGATAWGYMRQSDGTTVVPNGIVYMQLNDADASGSSGPSQWFSARTNNDGLWSFGLANVRTGDFQAYYVYTAGTDTLQIVGQGGILGTYGVNPTWILPSPTADTQYDMNLSQSPTAVSMMGLWAYNANPTNLPLWFGLATVSLAILFVGLGWVWRRRTRPSGA